MLYKFWGLGMAIKTNYSTVRQHFAEFWQRVEEDREAVIITRRGHEDVALDAASELTSLLETAHLLRSPANARRLLQALHRALGDGGEQKTVDDVKRELGLGDQTD